jgi:hypothetical protein
VKICLSLPCLKAEKSLKFLEVRGSRFGLVLLRNNC